MNNVSEMNVKCISNSNLIEKDSYDNKNLTELEVDDEFLNEEEIIISYFDNNTNNNRFYYNYTKDSSQLNNSNYGIQKLNNNINSKNSNDRYEKERKDTNGVQIIKKSKQHKVNIKENIIEIIDVDNYKHFNSSEHIMFFEVSNDLPKTFNNCLVL